MRAPAIALSFAFLVLAGCTSQDQTEGSSADPPASTGAPTPSGTAVSDPVPVPVPSPVWEPLAPGLVEADVLDTAFDPGLVTIERGNSVEWTNRGALTHSVVSDDGGFSGSGAIAPGETFSFAFNAAGDYAYHCRFHPDLTGTVRVR